MILKWISKLIGWILKPLIFILSIFSHTSTIGSQAHMSTQRETEMQAQFKYDDVKEKLNNQRHS
jgi:hypothetical protein